MRNFAAGHDGKGNRVSAATQAKAVAALAEENKRRGEAKATRSDAMTSDTYDADGLDESWDDPTGLDLEGVGGMEDLDEAARSDPEFADWLDAEGEAQRAKPKLGSGKRFEALKSELAGKGIRDPGALAAHIGRKKYGKQRFAKLGAKARKPAAAASRFSPFEIHRMWPLEECRIMRAAEGREYQSGRVVEAYAAVYGIPVEIKDHEGHYEEEIDNAAFDEVLRSIHPDRNNGHWRTTCLFNHGMTVHGTPAERFSLPPGVPRHIQSADKGLVTRTEYAKTPLGDELLELVDIGALRSQSFTGGIIRSNPPLRGPGDRYRKQYNGMLQRVRRLVLGLREYGLTPFPAYSGAEVLGVRMQLPGGFSDDPEPLVDDTEFEAALAEQEGDGYGGPPEEGASRSESTGHRLYALRTSELLARAGIALPEGREGER